VQILHVLRKIITRQQESHDHVFTVYRCTNTFLRKIIMRPQYRAGDLFVSCSSLPPSPPFAYDRRSRPAAHRGGHKPTAPHARTHNESRSERAIIRGRNREERSEKGLEKTNQKMGMKRTDSLREFSAVARHIPTYLEGRVAQESFLHEVGGGVQAASSCRPTA
jgi:hypothetical protein